MDYQVAFWAVFVVALLLFWAAVILAASGRRAARTLAEIIEGLRRGGLVDLPTGPERENGTRSPERYLVLPNVDRADAEAIAQANRKGDAFFRPGYLDVDPDLDALRPGPGGE